MAKSKPSKPKSAKITGVAYRASPEFLAWLDEAVAVMSERLSVQLTRTQLMDIALTDLATKLKIPQPPKRY